ncbi:MAG: hypothetical protein JW814_03990 [Candidatus Krumholzibacteriota bacterium]|nr:hypothetical protein [Candidatus Krumholzibacteriota bacterium]
MNKIRILGLIVLVIFMGAGCNFFDSTSSTPDTEINTTEATIDLNSPTGGYTEDDESPAFGEEYQFALMGNEPLYGDPLQNEEAVANCIRHRYAKVFRLRSIWGNLANTASDTATADCCGVDWTGGMKFRGGYIVIEKAIRFDPNDYITRIDRSTIEWVSKTYPHIDGIQVKLVVPPGPADSTICDSSKVEIPEPVLYFKAGPFERTFTLRELIDLQLMQPVDRCGNGIMIGSHIIPPDCPNGYLFGKWRSIEPDSLFNEQTGELRGVLLGNFRGVWMSEHGIASGYLRGIAGINSAGEHKFFGKYINMNGRFRGILRGDYGLAPTMSIEDPGFGWFEGEWLGRDRLRQGVLKGEWISDGEGLGFFHGKWKMDCYFVE